MRIGEVAARSGLTPRTVRYYEQIGLLPSDGGRGKGQHRHYDEADARQLGLIHLLTTIMGSSLDEVRAVVRPELAAAVSDARWDGVDSVSERLRIVETAIATVDALLARVRQRRDELDALEAELEERLAVIESRRIVGA